MKIKIKRTTGWQVFNVNLPSNAYVLDALEEAKRQDSSLLFRHSCHHGSCGSCGVLINGKEHLACLTQLSEIANPKNVITIEPLRNFPVIGDLVVDYSSMFESLDRINLPPIQAVHLKEVQDRFFTQFDHCIECGLCLSACPITGSDPQYVGPAALAAAWRLAVSDPSYAENILLVDNEHGVWRCHAAFECSEVCPAQVDPARSIMSLRHILLTKKLKV